MRFPSLKSALVFAAGFVSCLLCLALLAAGGYCLWLKPMADGVQQRAALAPPSLPSPADFNFTVFDANHRRIDFQRYRGRVVVLNFWATWCPPCQAELPGLGSLASHYAGQKDVAVLCVSEEPAAVVFNNRSALDSHAPLYSLDGRQTPPLYKSDTIPATFIIDKKGMIVFQHVGSANWSDASVIRYLDSLTNAVAL